MDLRKLHHTKAKQVKVSANPPVSSDGQNGDMQLIRSSNINNNELLYIKINDEWKIIGLEDRPDFASQRTVPNIEKIKYKDSNVIDINDTSLTIDRALTVSGAITGTINTAAQPNITSLGTLTTLTVDDITINGSTISDAGNFFVDVEGDIYLDANGGDIFLRDNNSSAFKFNLDTNLAGQHELDVYDDFKLDVTGDITLDASGGDIFGTIGSTEFMHYNYYKNRAGYHEGTTNSSGNIDIVFDGGIYDSNYGLFMYHKKTENQIFGLFAVFVDSSGAMNFVGIANLNSYLTYSSSVAYTMRIAVGSSQADSKDVRLVQLGGGLRVTSVDTP